MSSHSRTRKRTIGLSRLSATSKEIKLPRSNGSEELEDELTLFQNIFGVNFKYKDYLIIFIAFLENLKEATRLRS